MVKMYKIAHIGDIHISGKNFDRAKQALRQVSNIILEEGCDVVVLSGDIFDKQNIADRYKTVGEQQSLFMSFIREINNRVAGIFINTGNHDSNGIGKSSLEFMNGVFNHVHVIQEPEFVDFSEVGIGIIPWISKGNFESEHCIGKSKSESDELFYENIKGYLKCYKNDIASHKESFGVPCILLGHCDVRGTKVNEFYTVKGGSFEFTKEDLYSTGADYVSLSHIHKRGGMYVGALFQNNFGEEGNPQGFEIITIDKKEEDKLHSEYKTLCNMPSFKTIKVKEDTNNKVFHNVDDGNIYKIRFYSESKYKEFKEFIKGKTFDTEILVEKLWNKRTHVSRTNSSINGTMSVSNLLDEYIKINPLPDGLTKDSVKEVLNS